MKTLSPAALEVFASALAVDAGARTVKITRPLDRKLYVEVNAALVTLGGRWTRRLQAHVFDSDPAAALASIVSAGAFTDTKKDLDQFFTPAPLAAILADRADVAGRMVLEPSAGHGALARAALDAGARHVVCVEKDPKCCAVLSSLTCVDVCEDDFLALRPAGIFNRIIMNPPFSGQQDIAHVTHAHALLPRGGRVVAIMAEGVRFREDRKASGFRDLVAAANGSIEELPERSFRESGTDVRTVLVTLEAA